MLECRRKLDRGINVIEIVVCVCVCVLACISVCASTHREDSARLPETEVTGNSEWPCGFW